MSPKSALQGRKWAVVYDFGSHLVTYDTYMTLVVAERTADELNRSGCSPGGTPYEAARIAF